MNGGFMQIYSNLDGDSGVQAFEIEDTYIVVQFRRGPYKNYRYSYNSAGIKAVESMKALARAGRGLNAFINTNVRDKYESKTA